MSGQDGASSNFFGRIGSFTADGNGNITGGIEDVNFAGSGSQTLAFTSSAYSVQADGRGEITLTNATGTLAFSITMLSPTQGLIVKPTSTPPPAGLSSCKTPPVQRRGLERQLRFDFSGLDPGGAPIDRPICFHWQRNAFQRFAR
jgi:hypothetical protein